MSRHNISMQRTAHRAAADAERSAALYDWSMVRQGRRYGWRFVRIGILAGTAVFASRVTGAQQAVAPAFAPWRGAPAPPFRVPLRADAADNRVPFRDDSPLRTHEFTAHDAMLPLVPPRRPRGPIALRGLAVGAVADAVVGYFFGRHEEYGGAVLGPIYGGVVGAPVGMIALLLLSPQLSPRQTSVRPNIARSSQSSIVTS